MAELCAESLKRTEYAGEFAVITGEWSNPYLGRTYIYERFHPREFDRVMYVDADCLFLRDPTPLLKHTTAPFAVAWERVPIYMSSEDCTQRFLTPEERQRFKHHAAINTGVFIFEPALLEDFFAGWRALCESGAGGNPNDQPAATALLLRQVIKWQFLPTTAVSYPCAPLLAPPRGPETFVEHFCAAEPLYSSGEHRLRRMKEALCALS